MRKHCKIFFGTASLVQSELPAWVESNNVDIVDIVQSQSCVEFDRVFLCITVVYLDLDKQPDTTVLY